MEINPLYTDGFFNLGGFTVYIEGLQVIVFS